MPGLSDKTRLFFANHGQRGGIKRSHSLSQTKRSLIAKKAARARWAKSSSEFMKSVRLDSPALTQPVYLDELLSEGSCDQWQDLYRNIVDRPFGTVAMALEKVLSSTHVYGVTPLWKGILRRAQGHL